MFGRRRDNDEIGPSKGLMKWVNKFFRFVLYPFIHPKIFLGLLVLLIAAGILVPLLVYKVDFKDMGGWYKELWLNSYQQTEKMASPLKEKVLLKYKQIAGDKANERPVSARSEEMVDYQIEMRGRRTAFSQTEEVKDGVETKEIVQVTEDGETNVEAKESLDSNKDEKKEAVKDNYERQVYFKHSTDLGLTYLDKPEKVEGRATVINANEIFVGTKSVYFYGIYAQLGTENARKAAEYMMNNVDGRQVDCYIGAYTSAEKATAICYFNGKSINHELVNKGFSQNVSLY